MLGSILIEILPFLVFLYALFTWFPSSSSSSSSSSTKKQEEGTTSSISTVDTDTIHSSSTTAPTTTATATSSSSNPSSVSPGSSTVLPSSSSSSTSSSSSSTVSSTPPLLAALVTHFSHTSVEAAGGGDDESTQTRSNSSNSHGNSQYQSRDGSSVVSPLPSVPPSSLRLTSNDDRSTAIASTAHSPRTLPSVPSVSSIISHTMSGIPIVSSKAARQSTDQSDRSIPAGEDTETSTKNTCTRDSTNTSERSEKQDKGWLDSVLDEIYTDDLKQFDSQEQSLVSSTATLAATEPARFLGTATASVPPTVLERTLTHDIDIHRILSTISTTSTPNSLCTPPPPHTVITTLSTTGLLKTDIILYDNAVTEALILSRSTSSLVPHPSVSTFSSLPASSSSSTMNTSDTVSTNGTTGTTSTTAAPTSTPDNDPTEDVKDKVMEILENLSQAGDCGIIDGIISLIPAGNDVEESKTTENKQERNLPLTTTNTVILAATNPLGAIIDQAISPPLSLSRSSSLLTTTTISTVPTVTTTTLHRGTSLTPSMVRTTSVTTTDNNSLISPSLLSTSSNESTSTTNPVNVSELSVPSPSIPSPPPPRLPPNAKFRDIFDCDTSLGAPTHIGSGATCDVFLCALKPGLPNYWSHIGSLPPRLCVKIYRQKALTTLTTDYRQDVNKIVRREFAFVEKNPHPRMIRLVHMFIEYIPPERMTYGRATPFHSVHVIMEYQPGIPSLIPQTTPSLRIQDMDQHGGTAELYRYFTLKTQAVYKKFHETTIKYILAQLLIPVMWLHEQQPPIIHRDLKLENAVVCAEVTVPTVLHKGRNLARYVHIPQEGEVTFPYKPNEDEVLTEELEGKEGNEESILPHSNVRTGNSIPSSTAPTSTTPSPVYPRQNIIVPVPIIKLMDFGLARALPIERIVEQTTQEQQQQQQPPTVNFLQTAKVGSGSYIAPEVCRITTPAYERTHNGLRVVPGAQYGTPYDIYSLGIILYTLATVKSTSGPEQRRNGIHDDNLAMERSKWLSKEGRDLLWKMVKLNPNERLSARQCLQHPWFNDIRETLHELIQDRTLLDVVMSQDGLFRVPEEEEKKQEEEERKEG